MNTQFEQYVKMAKDVAMTAEEKNRILGDLKMAMETFSATENTSGLFHIPSPYYFYFTREKVLVFALMFVFLVTTGTSFAAGTALPGDILYPVKVSVNEEVKGFFARTPAAKANFHAGAALTRLQEAEELQAQGKLDEKIRSNIESNFETHAANVKANLSASSSDSDYEKTLEIANNFESSLNAHKDVFVAISAETKISSKSEDDTAKDTDHMASVVARVANEFTSATSSSFVASRLDISADSATKTEIEQKLNLITAKISNTEAYIKKVDINDERRKKALDALEVPKNLVVQAKIRSEKESYKEAFLMLTDANNLTGKIYSSIKVENEANIGLKGIVNIQTGRSIDLNKSKNDDVDDNSTDNGTSTNASAVSSTTSSMDRSSFHSDPNADLNKNTKSAISDQGSKDVYKLDIRR